MRKKYNTPHRSRVIKTRLTEEEYSEFSERVTLCQMSQSEYIRQALMKSRITPVIAVSPVNEELLSAIGKLTAEYGKIGSNLNQIARYLNEYGNFGVPAKPDGFVGRGGATEQVSFSPQGGNEQAESATTNHALPGDVKAAISDLAALKFEVLQKVGEAVGDTQTYQL